MTRLSAKERRVLELLASDAHGATEEFLVLAQSRSRSSGQDYGCGAECPGKKLRGRNLLCQFLCRLGLDVRRKFRYDPSCRGSRYLT